MALNKSIYIYKFINKLEDINTYMAIIHGCLPWNLSKINKYCLEWAVHHKFILTIFHNNMT